MASCEKCWRDSGGNPNRYSELVKSRNCTPEEQAGMGADICMACNRATMHIYCGICMNPACGSKGVKPTKHSEREL